MGKYYHIETVPYGTTEMSLRIPKRNYLGTFTPRYRPGVEDEPGEIIRALHNPIGTPTLEKIMAQKKGRKTVVVVNDVSRPTLTNKLLPLLIQELKAIGIPDEDILILIATGTHRDVRQDEFEILLGKEIAEKYQVRNHHCRDRENMIDLGRTSQGVPVVINKQYYQADLKILTGSIHPHQTAGFSGGRKSILPGLASVETLKLHHGYDIRPLGPAMGWIEENLFHLAALEAAKMAGVDFILNLVQNQSKQISLAVAGDIEAAWMAGIKASRKIFEIAVPKDIDILVVIPGGHPRDSNLYQSQRSLSVAEMVIKPGGTIILPAACPDGIGGDLFYEWMAAASCPEDVLERFKNEGFDIGTSKAWLYSRCLAKAQVIVVTEGLGEKTLNQMLTLKARDIDKALAMALDKHGKDSRVCVLKNAVDIIPR